MLILPVSTEFHKQIFCRSFAITEVSYASSVFLGIDIRHLLEQ